MPDAIADEIENRKIKNRQIEKLENLRNRKSAKDKFENRRQLCEKERLEKRTTKAKRCKSLLEGQLCADSLAEAR